VIEALTASPGYSDIAGAYWKGTLAPKTTSDIQQANTIEAHKNIAF
jgi:hypothetical protein